jgi:flagellar motility protein MotE (MotC chaperone)
MNRWLRDVRLIPIVLVAAAGLFALKLAGIVTDGGYTLGAGHLAKSDRITREAANSASLQAPRTQSVAQRPEPAQIKQSWAQEVFNYPDVTGSVGATKPAPKEAAADAAADKKPKPVDPKPAPAGIPVQVEAKPLSVAERAVLERLTERRLELDQRARELDMRETLLQATEKRIEARVNELKEVEARITAATQKKEESDQARLKGLVTMYESMKAKEAAKIFDRLDIKLATEVAKLINPRRMSDILAQMSPEGAERLTVELASRGPGGEKPAAAELPKIEGRPTGGS